MGTQSISVPFKKFDDQLDFCTKKLGFQLLKKNRSLNNDEVVVLIAQDHRISLIPAKETDYKTPKKAIIINTEDCLMHYYTLKEKGVRFTAEPQYSADGLAASFIDPSGNHWLLLERRDYNDI